MFFLGDLVDEFSFLLELRSAMPYFQLDTVNVHRLLWVPFSFPQLLLYAYKEHAVCKQRTWGRLEISCEIPTQAVAKEASRDILYLPGDYEGWYSDQYRIVCCGGGRRLSNTN